MHGQKGPSKDRILIILRRNSREGGTLSSFHHQTKPIIAKSNFPFKSSSKCVYKTMVQQKIKGGKQNKNTDVIKTIRRQSKNSGSAVERVDMRV